MPKRKSLKTYLKVYCKNLSDSNDYRLTAFFSKLDSNPRLEGPLFLYATMYFPNESYVTKTLGANYFDIYNKTLNIVNKYDDLNKLKKYLPYEESKTIEAYMNYCNENSAESSLKKTYQKKIVEKLNMGISNYKVCKDNNINFGNFHAFINGAYDKLSLDKCRKIYKYLEDY